MRVLSMSRCGDEFITRTHDLRATKPPCVMLSLDGLVLERRRDGWNLIRRKGESERVLGVYATETAAEAALRARLRGE